MFVQRCSRLTTQLSKLIPIVKRCISVLLQKNETVFSFLHVFLLLYTEFKSCGYWSCISSTRVLNSAVQEIKLPKTQPAEVFNMSSLYTDSCHIQCGMLGLKYKLVQFDCTSV